jgi:hypothetical protein
VAPHGIKLLLVAAYQLHALTIDPILSPKDVQTLGGVVSIILDRQKKKFWKNKRTKWWFKHAQELPLMSLAGEIRIAIWFVVLNLLEIFRFQLLLVAWNIYPFRRHLCTSMGRLVQTCNLSKTCVTGGFCQSEIWITQT